MTKVLPTPPLPLVTAKVRAASARAMGGGSRRLYCSWRGSTILELALRRTTCPFPRRSPATPWAARGRRGCGLRPWRGRAGGPARSIQISVRRRAHPLRRERPADADRAASAAHGRRPRRSPAPAPCWRMRSATVTPNDRRAVGQDDGEFLAADARHRVHRPHAVRAIDWATDCGSTMSPAAWPCWSLTALKWSMSSISSSAGSRTRATRSISRPRRHLEARRRLASPVNASLLERSHKASSDGLQPHGGAGFFERRQPDGRTAAQQASRAAAGCNAPGRRKASAEAGVGGCRGSSA